ncbi:hypothetical protein [Capnocytophaga sputigena]|uniref:Uncharacterized protein n=1 Tax=Capnocytophaga sputigena TaxID=1019 RepID=A0AAX2IBX3_CAPSP|nr:hypothetical protein [Capnocytophaga sputigena]ATA84265.1 hypothetical protein CGC55_06985 [Capnocytophaga sputigena]EEB65603.1 hypothetical protein CAPSP0001_1678 [Capnocytophaga sputigena ATCC 33612]SQA75987.1 Uncharacterised protein [Capnocytophaga sputigena]
MDKFYVICSLPLFLFAVIFLYFTIVRKNAFEKRLTLFRPTQRLSQKRETYMQGVHKYSKYVNIILLVIFYLPLCIFMVMMLKEEYEKIGRLSIPISNDMKMFLLIFFVPILLLHYLAIYVIKRNEKALRMLVEQMSDTDFETLLKVKDSLPSISKYSPPFVLCNKKLYIFLFYAIRKIDPTQITEINWENNKNSIFIRLKSPKRTMFTLSHTTFPYFLQIVEQYTKLK